jgi:hypothetical protein
LGNERLALFVLGSLASGGVWDGNTVPEEEETGSKSDVLWPFASWNALVDFCASRFWAYSGAEIRCLSEKTVHALLSSPSLAIESENALLDVLVGSEMFEYWNYIEIGFLSSNGVSRYVEHLPFDCLASDIWAKVACYLRGSPSDELRFRRFRFCDALISLSAILKTYPSPLRQFSSKKWTLLYRGSRDGFHAANFHKKCDSCANTVTLILSTNGCVFGGFTSVPWDSANSWRRDLTPPSFLFSVKNCAGIPPMIFPITNNEKAICGVATLGPLFGGGIDLCVADNCDANITSYSRLGHSYRNDTGLRGEEVLAGNSKFQVKEIEVFSVAL